MEIADILVELTSVSGVSGFETDIVKKAGELISPFLDRTGTDALGSLIGYRYCGRKNAKMVMLDAHLDQVGLMVTEILDGGFLRFCPVGGIDPRILPGAKVRIGPDLCGVITCIPPHLKTKDDRDKAALAEDMAIDAGLSEQSAREKIKVGTFVTVAGDFTRLSSGTVLSPALDDRTGFAVIIRTLNKLSGHNLSYDLAILGSVLEERNLAGASTGAYSINPDMAVCIDTSHAKTPDAPSGRTFPSGCGALIGVGPNLNRAMSGRFIQLAKQNGIPHKLEVMEGNTGTNAWAIQVSRFGVPCALLSIPLKYMHTQAETIVLSDAEAVSDLLYRFLADINDNDRFLNNAEVCHD